MMNRAHTLQMAAPVSLRKSPIVLWSGTSWPGPAPSRKRPRLPRFSRRIGFSCTFRGKNAGICGLLSPTVPFRHLHGQVFCIASTASTRKSSCIRSGCASTYVTATRALRASVTSSGGQTPRSRDAYPRPCISPMQRPPSNTPSISRGALSATKALHAGSIRSALKVSSSAALAADALRKTAAATVYRASKNIVSSPHTAPAHPPPAGASL